MSGHSKWSKVKHQKEATDALKGKAFTKLASSIIIAVKEGGSGDPESNFRLRLAIEKARSANMPKENIERAIEKGIGKGGGGLEKVVYEAFALGKIGLIIEAATDNHQRTTAEIKNVLERHGGVLGAMGSVSYLFDHIGQIITPKDNKSYDEMMTIVLDVGGEDITEDENNFNILTRPADLHKVTENLIEKGIKIDTSELIFKPKSAIKLEDSGIEKIDEFIDSLENIDDVQKVYSNME